MVLSWIKEDIAYARSKAHNDNPGKSSLRIQWIRASIYGCSVYLQGLRDRELDDLMLEIEKIKAHIGMVKNEKSKLH